MVKLYATLLKSKMAHLSLPMTPRVSNMTDMVCILMIKYEAYITTYEIFLPNKSNLTLKLSLLEQLSLKLWSRGPFHQMVHEVKTIRIILTSFTFSTLILSCLYSGVSHRLLGVCHHKVIYTEADMRICLLSSRH